MCDYSLQNVKTRPAKVGDKLFTVASRLRQLVFVRQKTSTLQCVCFQVQSWPSPAKLSALVYGRGARISSPTKPRSSGRSMLTAPPFITMPWNFLTATWCS